MHMNIARTKFLRLLTATLAAVLLNLPLEHASARNGGDPGAEDKKQRVLGVIENTQTHVKQDVSAPATVRVGEDFKVTIMTAGDGCYRQGDEGVIFGENSATVMVYDFTLATHPDVVCALQIIIFPHTVTLRFSKPGQVVISIWARRVGKDTPPEGAPTVLKRRVLVKP